MLIELNQLSEKFTIKKLLNNNKIMKKNISVKIVAIIALLGIILWAVSTWALVLYETLFAPQTTNQETTTKSEEIDLSSLLKDTWSTNQTWITIETNTWLTK